MKTQKSLNILFLMAIVLSVPNFGFSEDGDAVPTNGEVTRTNSDSSSSDDEDSGADYMEKLLEIPEVAKIKKQCMDYAKSTGVAIDLGECIWSGKVNGTKVLNGVEDQEDVKTKIAEKSKQQDENGKKKDQYQGLQLANKLVDKEKDPAIVKLEEFLFKKLEKGLYGEGKEKNQVEHDTFYTLYKMQLGKNLLGAYSEFCFNSDFITNSGLPLISADETERARQRKKNIEALSDPSGNALFKKDKGDTTAIEAKYSQCVISIQKICEGAVAKVGADGKLQRDVIAYGVTNDHNYTRNQACLATQQMEEARQGIRLTDKILKRIEDKKESGDTVVGLGSGRLKTYESKGDNSLNALTTLTSNEAVNESGFDETSKEEYEKFKSKCHATDETDEGKFVGLKNGGGVNNDGCKDFVNFDREKLEEKLAEQRLRIGAQSERLKGKEFNEEEIKRYLIEEGYTEENAQKMIAQNGGVDFLKEMIQKRYEEEKVRALAEIRNRAKLDTVKGDKVDFNNSDDKEVLKSVASRLANRAEEFKQLIHFNNIASSFLEIVEDGKEQGSGSRNIVGLQKELADSAYKKDDKSSGADTDIKNLKQKVEDSEVLVGSGDAEDKNDGSANLGLDVINDKIKNYIPNQEESLKKK